MMRSGRCRGQTERHVLEGGRDPAGAGASSATAGGDQRDRQKKARRQPRQPNGAG